MTRHLNRHLTAIAFLLLLGPLSNALPTVSGQDAATQPDGKPDVAGESELSADKEAELISAARQITFEGRRAGEGYFSADGRRMVFQSERDPANPFYQIFLMDLDTGDIEQVSPGQGKTTCAWIHPDGQRVLFSSTHHDPTSVQQQSDLLERRRTGDVPRYAWDYDPEFEIYQRDADRSYRRLTNARGYDAEASYSPDGKLIAFASNRAAYSRDLSPREQELLKKDKQYFIDIYIMNADGTDVRRLTDVPGYDGGPFFSPNGKRICWRRFSEDGLTAEIYTMAIDGSDVRRLTNINAMSWAPFYHPSGDYLIFTTNRHGFANFELYCIRADGQGDPVRVTYTDGFDGLPVLLPDGNQIAWTSNRTAEKRRVARRAHPARLGSRPHRAAQRHRGVPRRHPRRARPPELRLQRVREGHRITPSRARGRRRRATRVRRARQRRDETHRPRPRRRPLRLRRSGLPERQRGPARRPQPGQAGRVDLGARGQSLVAWRGLRFGKLHAWRLRLPHAVGAGARGAKLDAQPSGFEALLHVHHGELER